MSKAITLLSGGMDSTTVLAMAVREFDKVVALSFDYGSKHKDAELESARRIANYFGVEHQIIQIPRIFKGSALTEESIQLPTNRKFEEMTGIAPSYVPARNTVFLSLAAAVADSIGAECIFYGAHREDHVGYPDCRPEFVEAISHAISLGTKHGVTVRAPFVHGSKADIVRKAMEIGAPLHLTHSCYQGKKPACGVCDTCLIRIDAFKKAGYKDPIEYAVDIDWE